MATKEESRSTYLTKRCKVRFHIRESGEKDELLTGEEAMISRKRIIQLLGFSVILLGWSGGQADGDASMCSNYCVDTCTGPIWFVCGSGCDNHMQCWDDGACPSGTPLLLTCE